MHMHSDFDLGALVLCSSLSVHGFAVSGPGRMGGIHVGVLFILVRNEVSWPVVIMVMRMGFGADERASELDTLRDTLEIPTKPILPTR